MAVHAVSLSPGWQSIRGRATPKQFEGHSSLIVTSANVKSNLSHTESVRLRLALNVCMVTYFLHQRCALHKHQNVRGKILEKSTSRATNHRAPRPKETLLTPLNIITGVSGRVRIAFKVTKTPNNNIGQKAESP